MERGRRQKREMKLGVRVIGKKGERKENGRKEGRKCVGEGERDPDKREGRRK
jgi:hypothetical protein